MLIDVHNERNELLGRFQDRRFGYVKKLLATEAIRVYTMDDIEDPMMPDGRKKPFARLIREIMIKIASENDATTPRELGMKIPTIMVGIDIGGSLYLSQQAAIVENGARRDYIQREGRMKAVKNKIGMMPTYKEIERIAEEVHEFTAEKGIYKARGLVEDLGFVRKGRLTAWGRCEKGTNSFFWYAQEDEHDPKGGGVIESNCKVRWSQLTESFFPMRTVAPKLFE